MPQRNYAAFLQKGGKALKCLYSNACSMGNKQEKMEVTVYLESYDLIAFTKI